jgi:hypothetical protein
MSEARIKVWARGHSGEATCALCGSTYEQTRVAATLYVGDVETGEICPDCLDAGPRDAALRAMVRAAALSRMMHELIEIATNVEGMTNWPSSEELRKVYREAHRFVGDIDAFQEALDELGIDPDGPYEVWF